tara:strand:- start:735 stop:2222 length:1488 start_codon:yes stop_codon:yes gene_type:complete
MVRKNKSYSDFPTSLHLDEEVFRRSFEEAGIGMTIIGSKGKFLLVNQAFCNFIGYSADELYSMTVIDVTHPDDRKATIALRNEVISQGRQENQEEKRYIQKNGSIVWGLLNRSVIKVGDSTEYTIGQVQDITFAKETEQALRKSERRLNQSLDAGGIGTWQWNVRDDTHEWDDRIKAMFGVSSDEYEGTLLEDFTKRIHPDDMAEVTDAMSSALQENTEYNTEFRVVLPDGSVRWINSRADVDRDFDGKPIRMFGSAIDITQHKLVETMKNEFISTVSHELRTPLTSIFGSLGLLLGEVHGELPKEVKSMIEVAHRNADRLVRLINDILDIQKIESGKLDFNVQSHDIVAMVKLAIEANQAYAERLDTKIVLIEHPKQALALVDSDRFAQVMANLLSNAAKFSFDNSTVEVVVNLSGPNIVVAVADKGPGIPKEFQSKIFDKFNRAVNTDNRRQDGTGLGLAISKFIVEQHGGEIGFKSQIDVGTTFHFGLPVLE